MVRFFTFVGLCAATYVGVNALDNLVVWMEERRVANIENYKLEREAKLLKHQLLKEVQEKQAATLHEVVKKHHVHSDKDFNRLYKHLKPQNDPKLVNRHQEDKQHKLPNTDQGQQDNAKLLNRHKEDRKLPEKPLKKQDTKSVSDQPENCPGEVVAECLECGETFEIVEPVPHRPL